MEWISGIIVLLALLLLIIWNISQFQRLKQEQSKALLTLLQQEVTNLRTQLNENFNWFTQQLNERLKENVQIIQSTNLNIGQRLDTATRTFGEVERHLGELKEANRQIYEITKDIANLQNLFRAPRIRGGFGELFLSELLRQILPQDFYLLQYQFRCGEVVDAVIKLAGGLVPVDAKFPLESFRKLMESKTDEERKIQRKKFVADVKEHIDTIASKYILPEEGTFNFALMYIPAENVYYETVIKDESSEVGKDLATYALNKKVILVSPNSLYGYLQAIVLGLKGLQIEKNARQIVDYLAHLENDFIKFKEDFLLLGKHLLNAKNKFEEAEKKLVRFQDRLSSVEETKPLLGATVEIPSTLGEE